MYSELVDETDQRERAKWSDKKTESRGIIKSPANFTLF